MDVAVGSTNPVKRDAVANALAPLEATVVPVDVDSGVADQPRTVAETVRGAERRAERSLAASAAEYGIGLEGGVTSDQVRPGTWLVMWACVTDGHRERLASGPSLRLPAPVVEHLEAGRTLGEAMDHVTDRDAVGCGAGAIGVLTGGLVDRSDALALAVTTAFGALRMDLDG